MQNETLFIGIDSGSQVTKAVAVQQGRIVAKSYAYTEFDGLAAAQAVYDNLIHDAGVTDSAAVRVAATGSGRQLVSFAEAYVNEIVAGATGAHALMPEVQMVLDMGAEGSRVILLDENGAAEAYEINDRCASGAGTFIETCARALEIRPEDMGEYSLRHTKDIPMKAQCVVFVESEVISLIHQRETKENIAHGVHLGISDRLGSMFRRLGMRQGVGFIGGPAKNRGLVQCLEQTLAQPVLVPDEPEYVSALGAALHISGRQ